MTTNTAVFSFENIFSVIKRFVSPLNGIMFQLDTNGVVVSVEGDSFSLIGRKPEELIGKSLFEVYKEVLPITNAIRKALGGEMSEVADWSHSRFFNLQLLNNDRWAETTSFPIYDNDSEKIIGAILLLRDVTEQHHQTNLSEQHEKIFAAVINSSNDGILTRSDIANGSTYNPRLVEMFDGQVSQQTTESMMSVYEVLQRLALNADEIIRAQEQLLQTLEPQKGTLLLRDGRVYEWRGITVNTGIGTTGQTRIWKFHDVTEIHRNTEIIHRQKEEYRLLFESMTNGMLLADVIRGDYGEPINYIIADINPSFAAITNKLPSELIGCSMLEQFKTIQVLSHNFGSHWWKGLDEASFGKSGTFHICFPEIDSPYHEIVVFRTQKDQIGILQYDETARIQSEQSFRAMQAAVDHLSEPVLWLDMDGTICYGNEALLKSLKYDSRNAAIHNKLLPPHPVGAKIWEFDTQSSAAKYAEWVTMLKKDATLHFETIMRNYENTTFPIVVTCDFLEYGGKPFMVSCYHDLTEQISQIEVEQTARVKSQFLTNMSHELRTPLHGITGGIDLLLNTELNTKQRETAELIRISGQRLLSIVNDILSFSYLEKENPELQIGEFDLPELIEEVMKTSAVQIYRQNLELSCLFTTDIPQRIDGDINKLRQVLMALLNNGLKFTQKGNVKLTVALESRQKQKTEENEREENDQGVLRFTVSDTGIGIPQNQLNHLFQSFSQLDISFTKEYGGIGMGLALSHQLIRLMKGQIGVESQEHVGSTFWFTVPFTCKEKVFSVPSQIFFRYDEKATTINSVVHPDKNNANHSKNNLTAKTKESANLPKLTNVKMGCKGGGGGIGGNLGKILVVEDNRINQIVIGEILLQAGFQYEIAPNGVEAVEKFSSESFSLILMDCQMPVMDGFEATQKIRDLESKQTNKHIPIIALTANTMPEDEKRCLSVGMDAYCSKPVNAEKLIKMIERWI